MYHIGRSDAEENKRIFDALHSRQAEIDAAFGEPLDWQRLDERQASRIRHVIANGGLRDRERWPEIQEQMISAMVRLE